VPQFVTDAPAPMAAEAALAPKKMV